MSLAPLIGVGACFRSRHDRQRMLQHAPDDDAADFPVAVVAAEENHSATHVHQIVEPGQVLGRDREQLVVFLRRLHRAQEVDDVARIRAECVERSPLTCGLGLLLVNGLEVFGDRFACLPISRHASHVPASPMA